MKKALLILTALFFCYSSQAGKVRTISGAFFGKVVKITPQAVEVKTSYGTLKVPLQDVISIYTDERLNFLLKDGSRFSSPVTGFNPSTGTFYLKGRALMADGFIYATSVKKKSWNFLLDAGVSLAIGNTESYSFNSGLKFTWDELFHKVKLDLQGFLAGENGTSTDDYQRGSVHYSYVPVRRFFLISESLNERDGIAKLDLRSITSMRAGFYLIRRDDKTFSLTLGPAFYFEDYRGSSPVREVRAFGGFSLVWSEGPFSVSVDVTSYTPLQNLSGFFMQAYLDARMRVTSYISLYLKAIESYKASPPEGVKPNDLRISSGLSFVI